MVYHDTKRESFIYVGVEEGKDLLPCDGKTSDPYVVVTLPTSNPNQTLTQKSKVHKKTLTPSFAEHVHSYGITKGMLTPDYDPEITIDVFDWNQIQKHKFMGRVVIPLSKFVPHAKEHVDWYTLGPRKDKKKDKFSGSLKIGIQFHDPTIPEDELAAIKDRMKLAKQKINTLWIEFQEKKDKTSGEISSPDELMNLLEQSGILIAVMDRWSRKMADLDRRTHEAFIKDPNFRKFLGSTWFRCLDSDNSGKLSWNELIMGMNMLLEGNSEEMCRMVFRSQDLDKSGGMSHDEAVKNAELTAVLFRMGFSLGLELQKVEMKKAGLSETDFDGILNAITGLWDTFDLAKMEADLLFKYCDKDKDGVITEDEYVAFETNPTERAKRDAEIAEKMKPALAHLEQEVIKETEKLITRLISRASR